MQNAVPRHPRTAERFLLAPPLVQMFGHGIIEHRFNPRRGTGHVFRIEEDPARPKQVMNFPVKGTLARIG